MDNIHAAFLNKKIKYLKKFNFKRNKIAKIYYSKLKDNENIELPHLRIKSKHTFHQFVIKVKKNRDKLIEHLTKKNIEIGIHYPKMVINLKPYKKNINKKEFKNCLKYENLILSLPIHPFLTYKEIFFICKNINNFLKNNLVKILHLINYFNDDLDYQENRLIHLQKNNGHKVNLITSDRFSI